MTHSAKSGHKRRRALAWLGFALPAVGFVAVFFFVPQILNLRFAFSNWTAYSSAITWNGLDNFVALAEQNLLANPIRITLAYAVIAMLIQNVVSLALAYALKDSNRVNGFFRSLFFVPVLLSALSAGYIWRGLLAPEGPVNDFIGIFFPGFDFAWLGSPTTALLSVAFIDAWKWIGLTTLVFIAGMNAIPKEVIESSIIDGATAWQRFRKVIFPMLAPAFTFNTVVNLIGAFSAYDVIMATTGGGPGTSTQAINIALRQQWGQGNFGTGSALGLVITLMVVVAAIPLVWALRKREAKL